MVHPHTHGEHSIFWFFRYFSFGSSPHAWGTLLPGYLSVFWLRFIPTRMGNTLKVFPKTCGRTVHPHTHGEHKATTAFNTGLNGSSPHAWGTQIIVNEIGADCRFIPTRMGNTREHLSPFNHSAVHPHTHGEHRMWLYSLIRF